MADNYLAYKKIILKIEVFKIGFIAMLTITTDYKSTKPLRTSTNVPLETDKAKCVWISENVLT